MIDGDLMPGDPRPCFAEMRSPDARPCPDIPELSPRLMCYR